MERWAYHLRRQFLTRATLHGFRPSIRPPMAWQRFPGVTSRPARQACAFFEAIERASLFDWWEGRCSGELVGTEWARRPGRSGSTIRWGIGVTAVTFPRIRGPARFRLRSCGPGRTFGTPCETCITGNAAGGAMVLGRYGTRADPNRSSGRSVRASACFFLSLFSSRPAKGHEVFPQPNCPGPPSARPVPWRIACDREVKGPWSRYATVWRVVIPPADGPAFLDSGRAVFFLVGSSLAPGDLRAKVLGRGTSASSRRAALACSSGRLRQSAATISGIQHRDDFRTP